MKIPYCTPYKLANQQYALSLIVGRWVFNLNNYMIQINTHCSSESLTSSRKCASVQINTLYIFYTKKEMRSGGGTNQIPNFESRLTENIQVFNVNHFIQFGSYFVMRDKEKGISESQQVEIRVICLSLTGTPNISDNCKVWVQVCRME